MKELKPGLCGFMRAKNEARFIESCIDSCIDSLDELIVVYNDCTDETPQILKRKQRQYPEKLKVYEYKHHILGFNLTKEEFDYVKRLPDDHPSLFCNECNYALSKISYQYALVIDPDQIYFQDELKKWRDVCSGDVIVKWRMRLLIGCFFMMYITLYRRLSMKFGKPIVKMMADWLINSFKGAYQEYTKWRLQKGKAAITLSGINVFLDKDWYVTFDHYNTHPPYNGATDHLIFPVTNKTHFIRHYPQPLPYAVTEALCQYNKVMFADHPVWFHQRANRMYCYDCVKEVKKRCPELFIPIEKFVEMSYIDVLDNEGAKAMNLFQQISFLLVHKMGVRSVRKHIYLLDKLTVQ